MDITVINTWISHTHILEMNTIDIKVSMTSQTILNFTFSKNVIVLVHMGQVRDAFLMDVYLDVRNPRGSGFWNGGYMSKGREMESQFASNLGTRWTDPVTTRRVPSK